MDIFELLADPECWGDVRTRAIGVRQGFGPYRPKHRNIAASIDLFFDHLTRLRGCHEIVSGEWSAEAYSFVAEYALTHVPTKNLPEVTSIDRFIVPDLVKGQAIRLVTRSEEKTGLTYREVPIADEGIAAEALASRHYGLRAGKPEEAKTETCTACINRAAVVVCRQRWEHDMMGTQELELIRLCPSCLSTKTISYRYRAYYGDGPKDWFSPTAS
jgi:hypothetical protein